MQYVSLISTLVETGLLVGDGNHDHDLMISKSLTKYSRCELFECLDMS